MLSYCLKCRKNNENKNSKVVKTKSARIMLSSNCVVCGKKKKNQDLLKSKKLEDY